MVWNCISVSVVTERWPEEMFALNNGYNWKDDFILVEVGVACRNNKSP